MKGKIYIHTWCCFHYKRILLSIGISITNTCYVLQRQRVGILLGVIYCLKHGRYYINWTKLDCFLLLFMIKGTHIILLNRMIPRFPKEEVHWYMADMQTLSYYSYVFSAWHITPIWKTDDIYINISLFITIIETLFYCTGEV